jgi:uncharacterized membrane protein
MATNNELTQDQLKRLVTSAAHKERRILSFSIVFSVIAILIGGLWLWYASASVALPNFTSWMPTLYL